MAEKNTQGAVHLTSLSLDLTEIQNNINTIETEMAALADSAVQYGEKIRNSLNMPSEQMTLSVDTTQFTQQVNTANDAISNFSNNVKRVTKEFDSSVFLSSDVSAIEKLVRSLGIADESIEDATMRVATLGKELDEYSKISISTQGGQLFRAIVTSTDEAGQSIRKVIDLTQEIEKIDTDANITISDNAKKRNAEIEKANNALANSLNEINKKYNDLSKAINTSSLDDLVKQEFVTRIDTAKNEIKDLQDEIRSLNYIASADEISPRVESINQKLAGISKNVDFAKDAQNQLSVLNKQFEKLADNVNKSNVNDLVKKELIEKISQAKTEISNLSQNIYNLNNEANKQNFESVYDSISKSLENTTNELQDAKNAQDKLLEDQARQRTLANGYDQLQKRVASLVASLSKVKLDTPEMAQAILDTKQLEENIAKAADTIRSSTTATKEQEELFNSLSSSVDKTSIALSHVNADIGQFQKYERLTKPLDDLNKQYEKLRENVGKSNLGDFVKQEYVDRISRAQNEIQELKNNIYSTIEVASKGDFDSEILRISDILKSVTSDFSIASKEQEEFIAGAARAENLYKSYTKLQNKLAGIIASLFSTKIDTPEMNSVIDEAEQLFRELVNVSESIKYSDYVAEGAQKTFDNYSNTIEKVSIKAKLAKAAFDEDKKSLVPFQQEVKKTIASLKTLEKAAVFQTSKKQVAELRAKYEEFLNTLKNTNIGVDVAQDELNKLNNEFTKLESTVKRGNGTLENWVNKISESAKWQIANSALNLIQNSFSQLTGTIIETEDAVIELQRVLNEKDLSGEAISSELYSIAYDFGQTFDAVQETAVKFAQTGLSWQEVVEATRATMLGLNTAELEVSTATEGLIAVMAQFGLEASDLEEVIDKINITADNFPVTSEKIVAALQRAGGTANAFGLSLEETIGIITALGEATGRTGEAIGTAMNSLISFSMKDTALAKFSEFLGKDVSNYDVLELWQELGAAINDSGASLAAMMSTSEEFNDLFDEGLATAVGLEDEFSKAAEETNQMLKDGKDIYSTVGTYRQNYFIALLNNIATAIEAIEGMGDAIGYSMQENETAMEAFSKKWNQLVIAAKELAVQFGEAGFLDSMKWLAETATSILKLTKSIGGLNTILGISLSIFASIKKQKIDSIFETVVTKISNIPTAITAYKNSLLAGSTATESMSAATTALGFSLGSLVSAFGLAYAGISTYISWLERQKQKRQENIQAGIEEAKNIRDIASAYNEYTDAIEGGDLESQNEKRLQLIKLLGYEAEDIKTLVEQYKGLKDGYNSTEEALKTLTEQEYEYARAHALQAKQDAERAFKDISGADYSRASSLELLFGSSEEIDEFFDRFRSNLNETSRSSMDLYNDLTFALGGMVNSADDAEFEVKVLNAALEAANSTLAKKNPEKYADLIGAMADQADKLTVAINNSEVATNNYNNLLKPFSEYLKELAEDEENAAQSGENFAGSNETVVMSLEEMDEAIDNLNKKMDSFQSSVNSIKKVIEEYNETGIMTADMLQTLMSLSPEYIDLIDANSGALSINQEKLESLMVVNDNYMVQMAAMKVARETETLVTKLQTGEYNNLTVAEITAKLATEALGGEVYKAAMQFYTGQINAQTFGRKIEEFGRKAGLSAEKLEVLRGSVVGLTDDLGGFLSLMNATASFGMDNLINGKTIDEWREEYRLGNISSTQMEAYWKKYQNKQFDKITSTITPPKSSGTKTWFPSTSTSSKSKSSKETDPYKEEKKALEDLLDTYEHSIFLIEKNEETSQKSADSIVAIYRKMQEEIHNTAEDYRQKMGVKDDEYTRSLSEKWWQIQETIEEVLQGVYEETVRSYNSALNLLEHQYETAEENMNYSYMGENLKKQLDYQVKIQREAERELERLAELGMDANDDAAQDVIDTWYEAERAIREISQKIADDVLEPYDDFIDLADQFELWDYMDFTKVDYLRDKLEAVNKLLEDGTITLKEYNEQLKDVSYAIYEAQKELYEKEKESISERYDALVDAYKADQESLKNQKDQVNDYYDAVIDGYNKEIEAWEKRKEEVEDYYDGLIENLNEVQEANERINAQVDYYNERQKIITNLEQAQSRSGVEWREKEMEYQQQLMDLDEDWRRTQEEWSIEDQIEAIEKLKEIAIQDIELSIQKIRDTITAAEEAKQAALDNIDAQIESIEKMIEATEEAATQEIEAINNKIQEMSEFIANAIKDGTVDGLVNSKEEFNKALVDGTNAMLEYIDKGNLAITNSATQTANNVYGIYDADFMTPMNNSIIEIANNMSSAITTGASEGAKQALNVFQSSFIEPVKKEMANLMKEVETAKATVNTAAEKTATTTARKTVNTIFPKPVQITSTSKAATSVKHPGITAAAWQMPGLTPFLPTKENVAKVNNVFITNNYKSISEAVRTNQNIISGLGVND